MELPGATTYTLSVSSLCNLDLSTAAMQFVNPGFFHDAFLTRPPTYLIARLQVGSACGDQGVVHVKDQCGQVFDPIRGRIANILELGCHQFSII